MYNDCTLTIMIINYTLFILNRTLLSGFNGGSDARVGATAADVATHERVDIGIVRIGVAFQQ